MKYRFVGLILAPLSFVFFLAVATPGSPSGQERVEAGTADQDFDRRDLSGIWVRDTGRYLPTRTDGGGDRGLSSDVPAMTAVGEARASTNIPGPGRNRRALFFKAVRLPEESNDPVAVCNPRGLVRLLLRPEAFEFVNTEDRLLLMFQWEGIFRELWLDGRDLPSGDNLANPGPAWYGHTVGAWQGDTLVANTVGLDDRQWLDRFGFPISPEARIEERYERIEGDTIELHLTLFDPTYYAEPWVSDTKTLRRAPPESYNFFGWQGLYAGVTESICAPMDEVAGYNEFRDLGNTPVPDNSNR